MLNTHLYTQTVFVLVEQVDSETKVELCYTKKNKTVKIEKMKNRS